MTTPREDRPAPGEVVRQALPDVLAGAAAGVTVGGPPGALAGAAAPALAALWRGARAADERQWQQAAVATQIAADVLEADVEAIVDQALADPGRTELLRRVVLAAGRSTIEDKVHALGSILATGLHDDGARLDEALPLAAAFAELDPAHVRLLAHMAYRDMYTDHPAQQGDRPRLGLHRLGEALPGSELVATSVLRTLERHGLVDDPNPGIVDGGDMSITDPDYIGSGYAVTPLGRRCLNLLRSEA